MTSQHRIVFADARQMSEVADRSVQLVVTSPPYWQLKDYGETSQIGFHDSYEEYVNNLNMVWQECARVLQPGCRLVVNIGDQFARSVYYGRYKVIPIRTEVIRFCETLGLDYMGAVIWQKVTTCNTTGGGSVMGSFPFPRNGVLKLDYEFILIFKKPGKAPPPSAEAKEQARLTTEEWNEYFAGHWQFPGVRQGQHLAAFPEELPRRLIRMFTFPGELVLDPFAGSCTTSLAARNLGRNSVAYEIGEGMLPLIKDKLQCREGDLFNEAQYEFIRRPGEPSDLEAARARLPYVFHDPVAVARQVDPRGQTYGSRIDDSKPAPAATVKAREVLGPNRLRLDDGRVVQLLGLRPARGKEVEAEAYLQDKVLGQRLTLKADERHPLASGLCYVYLANRTFVNAQLVKRGLAAVDRRRSYRHKERLLKYAAAASPE